MISLIDLHKAFGPNHVLRGVTLDVPKGTSMVVIGGSGTGKSVLLKCILGLVRPDSGTIRVDGQDAGTTGRDAFLARFGMLFQGGALFDSLPVWQNVAFRLLRGHGRDQKEKARATAIEKLARVGLAASTADLFPAELAASYEAQDRSLLLTGRAVRNQLEIITDASGRPGWYLSTKVLAGTAAAPEVLAVSVAAQLQRNSPSGVGGVGAAVELARRDVAAGLTVGDLAAAAGMSTDRLERAMRRMLGVSPKQYLLRTRVEQAALLLATTDRPISEIAVACGYFDQSQLSRQFAARVGVTPGRYRTLARPLAATP
jgi:AraC-like DNA-binding protein/ABC-type lipoprotein export system ATPase subunit